MELSDVFLALTHGLVSSKSDPLFTFVVAMLYEMSDILDHGTSLA